MEHGRFFCCPRFDTACTLGSIFHSMNADELHVILAAFLFDVKSKAGTDPGDEGRKEGAADKI